MSGAGSASNLVCDMCVCMCVRVGAVSADCRAYSSYLCVMYFIFHTLTIVFRSMMWPQERL